MITIYFLDKDNCKIKTEGVFSTKQDALNYIDSMADIEGCVSFALYNEEDDTQLFYEV